MKGFLAVSLQRDARDDLRRPVGAAIRCLTDANVNAAQSVEEDGWIVFSGADDAKKEGQWHQSPCGSFTIALGQLLRDTVGDRSASSIAPHLASADSALARLLPPFAVVHRRDAREPVFVAVDWLGFFQLYLWQGAGVAAISTSARALAALAKSKLDHAGAGVQAMMGWQIGDSTLFEGVHAVPAASVASLYRGAVNVRPYVEQLSFTSSVGRPPPLDDAVEEMATILRDSLENYLTEFPDAMLQLTGGHDSRILLGAISQRRRQGLRALTLGDERSVDVAIAANLCDRYRMIHEVHRVDQQAWPSPAGVHELTLRSAQALECHASPIALAPVLLAESEISQGYRLSGLGGEVARGFYYAGQPANAMTSRALVRRLAEWRLFINEAVEPDALNAEFLKTARHNTTELLISLFPNGEWLRATDEFYLYQRMRRWAGTHGTVATMLRASTNMMFDRRFVELALAVSPLQKRDSILLGRLMSRLDPVLANLPLDIGLVPSQLGQSSLRSKIAVAALSGRRIIGKVKQRVTGGRRPQIGAAAAASRLLLHWRTAPEVCSPLFEIPFISQNWLRGMLNGAHDVKPTTLAFFSNLLAAYRL